MTERFILSLKLYRLPQWNDERLKFFVYSINIIYYEMTDILMN